MRQPKEKIVKQCEKRREARSRYAESRPVETWADIIWNARMFFASAAMLVSPLLFFVSALAAVIWLIASVAWYCHEIDGYSKHWDETSDDWEPPCTPH